MIIRVGEFMENFTTIVFRTILIIFILFVLVKLIGKKQVSQLNLFDYIIGITMGSVAADISLDIEKDLVTGIVSLVIYGIFSVMVSYLTMKSIKLRRFIIGVPTILIENNKIIESGLRKAKLDINDLLTEARSQGYFKLEDIEYAIMEINGRISFMPTIENSPVTKKDINAKLTKESLVANVIIDSKVLKDNLLEMGKDKKWLDHTLKILGYDNYDNILLATLDINDKVVVYKKDVKVKRNSILE